MTTKLSYYQYVKEQLLNISTEHVQKEVFDLKNKFQSIKQDPEFLTSEFQTAFDWFTASSLRVQDEISNALDRIQKKIDLLYPRYLQHSDQAECFNFVAQPDFIRHYRHLKIFPETEAFIKARLGHYVSWQHPGLEIGPGDGQWTGHLVALDPLYVADIHQEFLDNTRNLFQEPYKSRLRPYLVKHTYLYDIPREQMGLVFSWNTFNYFNIRFIEEYLKTIFTVLKPGGVFMFSYNNCERYQCTELFEKDFMTFVPESILVKKCLTLGYEILYKGNTDTHVSWLEIKKPGVLSSQRAGQTLGKILTPEDVLNNK